MRSNVKVPDDSSIVHTYFVQEDSILLLLVKNVKVVVYKNNVVKNFYIEIIVDVTFIIYVLTDIYDNT